MLVNFTYTFGNFFFVSCNVHSYVHKTDVKMGGFRYFRTVQFKKYPVRKDELLLHSNTRVL